MFSRLFGSDKKKEGNEELPLSKWSFLRTDIHSHLIPGIDDGAANMEDSLTLLKHFQQLGFTGVVTTPHIKSDVYANNPEIILSGLETLKREMLANDITISIKAAAEYYVDDHFMDMLEAGNLLTIQEKQVLIEFSFMYEPIRLHELIFRILSKGYKPIIAHPERYGYFHQTPEIFRTLKERGCLLQLNTISLGGYYGKPVKETAEKILAEGLYDYCGSDMHHVRHVDALRKVEESKLYKTLVSYPFLNKKISF